MFEYSIDQITSEPERFDTAAIGFLHDLFQLELAEIFNEVQEEMTNPIKLRKKIERHLFPALLIAKHHGPIGADFLKLCSAFVKGFSIPVIHLNTWLDRSALVGKSEICQAFVGAYGAQAALIELRNGSAIVKHLNEVYRGVTASLLLELEQRHGIPNVILEPNPEGEYYRSLCGYLLAASGATLEFLGIPISSSLRLLLVLYGVLRQMADEVCDVQEDLESGVVTLPVLHTHRHKDMRDILDAFWRGEIGFLPIEERIAEAEGYEKAWENANAVYHQCRAIKLELDHKYRFLSSLFIMYDLKLGQLYRLKANNWKENCPLE